MSFYGSANPPAVKLPEVGGYIRGRIVRISGEETAYKFQTQAQRQAKLPRVPDTFSNGDPKTQQRIVLQLDPGFVKKGPSDTGLRTLYVVKSDPRFRALKAHFIETGQEPQIGDYLEMLFEGTEPGQGEKDKAIYAVTRLEAGPAETPAGFYGSDEDDVQNEGELVGAGAPAAAAPKARPRARAAAAPPSGNGSI